MASECYCTSLRRATRKVAALYDAALEPVGVNIAQFALLRSVARSEPVDLTELARRTELDRSTIGRNVRVLERMGLLQLGRGEDQREASVSITEHGRRVLEDGAPLWGGVQRMLEDRIGDGAARELRSVLNNL
ncbi:transcriptional regulator, MarR family [Methylocella silvestris BL2]|uniref:Transcriptional regulator, MarR family n=1 Tax=Methylocella silvestris (strain DSM 15510 / CIP 108128 / LMG 27833 / NCIMB 13906 / BL2) TaxID=395965 RepID=B8EMD6_METSB|nr:MarR family transcriptional regulator [Methylocella silvestris]ACK52064.1 transcriptional regulator, MarR family [Methylocella silvestris BL2]